MEFQPKEDPHHAGSSNGAAAAAAPAAQEASTSASDGGVDVDMAQPKHRGQIALRKLYHETDKLIAVLYTSPSCGPCRCAAAPGAGAGRAGGRM